MAGYYDPNKDYSLAIKQAKDSGASAAEISRLQSERQNKIDAKYGGTDPYKGKSDIMGSVSSGSSTGSSGSSGSSSLVKGAGYVTGGYTPGATYGTAMLEDNPYYKNPVSGSGADMSRRPDLAGSYAVSNGYTVFYDEDGYATKAVKGVVDYAPHRDINAANGTYNTSGAWSDNEVLTAEDRQRIQAIRAQMQVGQITGDQANQMANQIRSGYGYTIDKAGMVTDLGALSSVDARRQAWGLPTNGVSAEMQNFLQLMYPEQQTSDPAALLAAQYALTQGTYDPQTLYTAPAAQELSAVSPYTGVNISGSVNVGNAAGGYGGDISDASQYLRDMYAQQIAAELAALKSTYEQNVADIQAQDDLIADTYEKQRNQAAAQNDLQRMQMNEYGIMRGLNSGTSGQMALAQSAAYQSGLAQLGSQEAQSLADNALNLTKLTAQYKNAADQAAAQGNAQLASALYNEYVRQQELAWQYQQAAQAQANWEAQFAYQQQQDALSQQNWETQLAYQQALDQQEYELALQEAARKAASSSGGTSISKPTLTYSQVMESIENGIITPNVLSGYQYYFGEDYNNAPAPGGSVEQGQSKYTMDFDELKGNLTRYLALGGKQRAQNILDTYWDGLTEAQQRELSSLFS